MISLYVLLALICLLLLMLGNDLHKLARQLQDLGEGPFQEVADNQAELLSQLRELSCSVDSFIYDYRMVNDYKRALIDTEAHRRIGKELGVD